jgi:hypothetical protein
MRPASFFFHLAALALTGCASSGGNWQSNEQGSGVQTQGQSLNSPVTDQSHNADQMNNSSQLQPDADSVSVRGPSF